ncbi:MAG: endo-1,4-beta-xylanase [Sporocytophaga sp.]|uniref:endo-1,4-beta-xylanase n=1 Tax=Sporocytophaga sp. TaxID=2231183 RepID=UPI001B1D3416|nr:endo-1,4-beta-xylanase [Sporocytophaga sp.]MBO9699090.1 endo-1,4-beta-xylanase [Sporocytophaga sp.]
MKKTVLKIFCLTCLLYLSFAKVAFAQIGKCKGKYFGNIIAYSTPSNYGTYWNQVTSENGSKWGSVEGTKGSYNFSNSDLAYNLAKNNNGLFKYHCFVWGGQTPGWVSNSSTSAATITKGVEDYIKACSTHYAPMGGLKLIDVLNEPVNTPMPGNMKAALTAGYQAEPANANDKNNQYGWVIWCFQLARKYFPNSTLLINEYNIEMNWNNCRAPYIAMVQAVKNAPNLTDGKKNLIDGVGLQCHGINNLTATNFKNCIDEIWNKTGVPIHITEFDSDANPNESKQQSVYSTLIPIAWEHPHVAGITLWGYIQGSTWVGGNGTLGPNGTDTGLLYSSNYSTKPLGERPAMTWLKQYMASQASLSCCPAPAPFASCNGGNNPPTVTFSSPAENTLFTSPAAITLTADASDADGSISNVQFYNGSTLLGSDNTAPYTFNWTNVQAGTYTIKVVATDNNGATAQSQITIKVNVPQGPYKGTAHIIPGTIQLEEYDLGGNGAAYSDDSPGSAVTPVVNYRTDEDVDIENCTDAGGGYNLGYTTAGEWLEYTVNVTKAGTYDMALRIACSGDGRTVSVAMDGKDIASNIAIPNTTGWQTWQTVTVKDINLSAGQKIMRVTIGSTDYVNMNFMTFTLTKELKQEPFKSSAHLIPGRIEAEEYDLGGEGLAYHEANANGNEGKATLRNDEVDIETTQDVEGVYNVGYILKDEWLEYTVNVVASGNYDLDVRIAADGEGKTFHIEMDGINVTGPITVANTGGWQTWQTVTLKDISLTGGEHIMRIAFDSDYMNLNYVEFKDVITGIAENESSSISVFPNPFSDTGIQINNAGNFNYKITDVSGILVESGNGEGGLKVGKNLSDGLYFLIVENNNDVIVHKIVKK